MKLNQYKKAIKYYRKVIKFDSQDKGAYYNLAIAYQNLGKKSKAKYYYNKYLEL